MEYLEIGEIREINGVKVQCLKEDGSKPYCSDCAFFTAEDCLPCNKEQREDYTDVYFKKVE